MRGGGGAHSLEAVAGRVWKIPRALCGTEAAQTRRTMNGLSEALNVNKIILSTLYVLMEMHKCTHGYYVLFLHFTYLCVGTRYFKNVTWNFSFQPFLNEEFFIVVFE